jgi:hypothetical protein
MKKTSRVQIGIGDVAILEKDIEITYLDEKKLWKRAERNHLLAKSDSKILTDRGISESKVAEWKTYRQNLRDLDFSDPENIIFPEKPE